MAKLSKQANIECTTKVVTLKRINDAGETSNETIGDLMNKIVYGILESEDYAGGGVTAIFSTYEKAKEYLDKIKPDVCSSVEIVEMQIDNPSFEGKNSDYRHG